MRALLLAAALALSSTAPAQEGKTRYVFPAASLGVSYPFILSATAGAFVPLGKREATEISRSAGLPSLRADIEAGLGGGSIAAGVYLPIAVSTGLSLKAASLRTWLLAWNQEPDKTYDGAIFEVVAFGHTPLKLGLGWFKERASGDRERDKPTYLFIGSGF